MSTRELYVYYRVTPADAAAAVTKVRSMQAGLRASHPGLQSRLLRRPAAPSDVQTWMEIYSIPGGVDESLQREIESAASSLLDWIQGPRHCEVFEALPFTEEAATACAPPCGPPRD